VSKGNGKAPPATPPEGLGPDMHLRIIEETLAAWAPGLAPEVGQAIALQVMGEQAALGPVLEDMLPNSPNAQKYPIIVMRIISAGGRGAGSIEAPKVLTSTSTLDDVAHVSHIIGLVTSPVARACLYAQGFRLEFSQKAAAPPKPLILLSGD